MFNAAVVAFIALAATYLYRKLHYKRFQQHAHLPQLDPSLILGHLKKLDDIIKRGPADRHPDYVFNEMLDQLGRPPLMFVDLRPVNRPLLLVTNHETAEQVSRASKLFPTSLPKSYATVLNHLIGTSSILLVHGDDWKALRKKYSSAFAPQHLMTLLPCILNSTSLFVKKLDNLASRGAEFGLVDLAVNLTFDIIGAVVMDIDFEAQTDEPRSQGELVRLYVELYQTYWDDKADWPWWLTPGRELKRRRLSNRIDTLLEDMIRTKHAEQRVSGNKAAKSILSLSLADTEVLTPQLIRETIDQVKTFLLAGHDTTSITFSWIIYLLSRTPHALSGIRMELDRLLGPDADPESIRRRLLLSDGPDLIRQMVYTSAVIKEGLRLHPPGATARYSKPGTGFTVRTPEGKEHCLDGMIIYNAESMIHRDPAVYGDTAEYFIPERWINAEEKSKIPASAWRPFERGPRGCIGQDLALIELRVIIAMTARRFDFVKVGLGELSLDAQNEPILNEHGMADTKSQIYNSRQVNAKPVDNMRMKVRVRGG